VGNPEGCFSAGGFGHCIQTCPGEVVRGFLEEKVMRRRQHTKLIHEGEYVAEVDVELVDTDEGWSPYLSLDDAEKLDDVREALRKGDLKAATQLARVYTLRPVAL
jgi:hypothetical protein